jgi:hypothetical protein
LQAKPEKYLKRVLESFQKYVNITRCLCPLKISHSPSQGKGGEVRVWQYFARYFATNGLQICADFLSLVIQAINAFNK